MSPMNLMKIDATEAAVNESQAIPPKWKLALALGVPLVAVIGASYYWYRTESKASYAKRCRKLADAIEEAHGSPSVSKPPGPDVAEAVSKRGNTLYRSGRYAEALEEFTTAIEMCPTSAKRDLAILYRNRASCYEQLCEPKKVVEECTKAIDLDPKYVKALTLRCKAWEKLDNLEEALFDITSTCILDKFRTPSMMENADRILKEIGTRKAKAYMKVRKPVLPSNYFIRNYLSSFVEDPIAEEAKALEPNGDDGDLTEDTHSSHYLGALRALKRGEYEEVLVECNKRLEQFDKARGEGEGDATSEDSEEIPKALLLRGTWIFLIGDGTRALADLTSSIEHPLASTKVKVNALIKRACQHLQNENVEQCFHDFDQAIKLDARNGDIYLHRGQVMMLIEKYDKAISDFDKAAALHPHFPMPQVQKRLVEYRRAFKNQDFGRISECSRNFRETIDKFPSCPEGCSILGQILVDLQQFAAAEDYMDRALKLNPEDAMILVHKGLLKVQVNDAEEAVKFMMKAVEVDPKCEYAYESWATLEVQRNNLEKAVELFEKAIELAKVEIELTHLISLRDAALTQIKIREKLGMTVVGSMASAGIERAN